MANPMLVCTPRTLPHDQLVSAAIKAVQINPANRADPRLVRAVLGPSPLPEHIAVLIGRRWHTKGVNLTVGFMDGPEPALRARILSHMNAWGKTANVLFSETKTDPQVRIARADTPVADAGYWSYLGTEILEIDADKPTMNLQDFTMETPDSEFYRVVRHETGHTLGFVHEHMRAKLVKLIDPAKAIPYFEATQGWSEADVRDQVLTPIDESLLSGTDTDQQSIMCYQIPGTLTFDGEPIPGGRDIDASDYAFAASIYPKP